MRQYQIVDPAVSLFTEKLRNFFRRYIVIRLHAGIDHDQFAAVLYDAARGRIHDLGNGAPVEERYDRFFRRGYGLLRLFRLRFRLLRRFRRPARGKAKECRGQCNDEK